MARNYIFTRFLNYHGFGDDGGGGHVEFDQQSCGGDDADLLSQVQIDIKTTESLFAPFYTWTWTYPNEAQTFYLLLDKPVLLRLAKQLAQNIYANSTVNGVLPPDQLWQCLVNPAESPRYTGWKEGSEDHKPVPTDIKASKRSGGFILKEISLIQNLSLIYSVIVQLPNPNAALRKTIRDVLTLIRDLGARRATQAEITAVLDELTPLVGKF